LKTKPISSSVVNLTPPASQNCNNVFFEQRIGDATSGLIPHFSKLLYKLSKENTWSIANYIISMRTEVNISDHYRRNIISVLTNFSIFYNNKSFRQLTRDEILAFLDSLRKVEDVDPMHKWVGTYNTYRIYIIRFLKWLYYPDIEPDKRPKPDVVENIPQLKRKEQSIYKPTDLWTEEDDILFLKYCSSKRIKCYHAISRDTSCRPDEILKLRIKDIVFKNAGSNQYAEILVNGKTGTRHIPLINSIPYLKDYLDHEHPQSGNPNSILICGNGRSLGRKIGVGTIYQIYDKYKEDYFPKLLKSPNVPQEDKSKIKELLKKPWNPYIRRHSALTQKSRFLKEHVLRQHAGWSGRSQMHLKYLHYYGNESNESILEAYGIVTKDHNLSDLLMPKQCPNCTEPNKPDSKFCAKCRMVLTYDAYSETLDSEKQKEDKLAVVEEKYNNMQSMLEKIIASLAQVQNPEHFSSMAQSLLSSGILKVEQK